jgi:hypothetical protein
MRPQWIVPILLALLLTALAPANPSHAHGRSVSYSSWALDADGASVSLRLKLLELSRIGPEALPPGSVAGALPPGSPDLPARAFPTELLLLTDGVPCPPTVPALRLADAPGWVRYSWRVECPTTGSSRLTIQSRLLLSVAPGHLHFARVRTADPATGLVEQVLTEAAPELVLRATEGAPADGFAGSRLIDYLRLGVEHILSGWDHLAFVFGLLLLATRLGEVARLVTGFTLAHSLTLALAVLDVVHPRAAAVEAVIAFSVALVAIEKGWLLAGRGRAIPAAVLTGLLGLAAATALGWIALPVLTVIGLSIFTACYFALLGQSRNEWLRVSLTFAFGLVHGFGFAGILMEMTLPADRLVPALLGFNLGVELGQIGVVLALWPLLWAGRRWADASLRRWAGELSAAALCGLGLYWLAERAISG